MSAQWRDFTLSSNPATLDNSQAERQANRWAAQTHCVRVYMQRILTIFFVVCVIGMCSVSAQEEAPTPKIDVNVKHVRNDDESFFDIQVSGFLVATPEQIWRVLTDYEHMQNFVPDMVSSKIIARNDKDVLVEQTTKTRFLFISKTIRVIVRVVEQPFSRLDISLVSGDMKQYSAYWELTATIQDGVAGTRIKYVGKLEPDSYMPSFLGTGIVHNNIKKTMNAMILEIENNKKLPALIVPN